MNYINRGKLIVMVVGMLLLGSGCVVSVEESYHPCDECYADEECVYDNHYDDYLCVQVDYYHLNPEETSPPPAGELDNQADEAVTNSPATEGGAHE